MPIDSKNRKWSSIDAKAQKVRDFIDGNVRQYIKRLPGHDDATFEKYKERAYYLPAVSRTLESFVGMVMTPEPVVSEYPDAFQPYLDDLTFDGEPFNRVAMRVVEALNTDARCVMLVDYPRVDEDQTNTLTRAAAESLGLRAYARVYSASALIDWRIHAESGARYTTHMRLLEEYEYPDPIDPYVTKIGQQIRVLDLDEERGGIYRVTIYRKPEEQGHWLQYGEPFYPMANGAFLTEIPAVVFNVSSLDPDWVEKPPLYELAGVAESHLNDSADCQWALAYCGSPTPWFSGLNPDVKAIKLGASEAIVLNENGKAGMLIMDAAAVGAIRQSMEDKRRDMASIGARLLSDETRAQVATDTAIIQRAGEHSVLAKVANTASDGLTRVLRYLADWAGIAGSENIRVKLNTDFLPSGLTPGELTEWVSAVQSGGIPQSVFIDRLKAKGVVRPDMSEDTFRDEIEQGSDALGFNRAGMAIDQSESTAP